MNFFSLLILAESDLETVSHIKNHFKCNKTIETSLFTVESRSSAIQALYNAAGKPPIPVIEYNSRNNGVPSTSNADDVDTVPSPAELYLCTPVLSESRKRMKSNVDVEIETRLVRNFLCKLDEVFLKVMVFNCKFNLILDWLNILIQLRYIYRLLTYFTD